MPRLGQRPAQYACDKGQQCTAKSKRSGGRCRNYACQDRETCRMHGGTSRRSREHWNYKTGLHSKDSRDAIEKFRRALERPVIVKIAFYPQSLQERIDNCVRGPLVPPRYLSLAYLRNGDEQLPLDEKLRVLRAARRELNARLREVQQAVRGLESEPPQAAEDAGPE